MSRILNWARANKEVVALAIAVLFVYSIYNYEREAITVLVLVLTSLLSLLCFHDARVRTALDLLTSRLSAVNGSLQKLVAHSSNGHLQRAEIAIYGSDAQLELDEYLSLGDLPPHLLSSLSLGKLRQLDHLKRVINTVKEFLQMALEDKSDPVGVGGLLHWCQELIDVIAIVQDKDET